MDNYLSLIEQRAAGILSGVPEEDLPSAEAVLRDEIFPLCLQAIQESAGISSIEDLLSLHIDYLGRCLDEEKPEDRLALLRSAARWHALERVSETSPQTARRPREPWPRLPTADAQR